MASEGDFRLLEKDWNLWLIAGAMVISFLGTFTSTQLMIQARTSTKFINVLTWIFIVSLTFGFCSSWSLHFVGMLSCELDVPIRLNVGLTLLTGALAVGFTFISLGKDILRKSYTRRIQKEATTKTGVKDGDARLPLLERDLDSDLGLEPSIASETAPAHQHPIADTPFSDEAFLRNSSSIVGRDRVEDPERPSLTLASGLGESSASNSQQQWNFGSSRVDDLMTMATQGTKSHKNAFIATFEGLVAGFSLQTVLMGLLWSLSLTCMHFGGLMAMEIPDGYMILSPVPVVLASLISWVVCIAGYIYMTNVEPFLSQQVLFSVVAAIGIASMHFTGLYAASFYTRLPPSDVETWPTTLPIAIWSIAVLTCMLANGLLAHSATLSRNKLAEIVWTRRKLWRTMAEKELAEVTAAARSSFIASASHEIRTPLHHLQGYTDLLSRSELKDADRQLLNSIQSATRTLSLITNNVLDWSKLESDMDTISHPTPLDMRRVSESIVHVLPNKEHDFDVEFMVVVGPSVPKILMLDETYIHRIFMNLLSNAIKFTRSGYVILTIKYEGDNLITQVKDTGIGIPPSFLPRLFEPFSQAETLGSQRGTGLGLSIIKQLLHKMNGEITVESHYSESPSDTVPSGTTFTVTIPAQQPSGHSPPGSPAATKTVALFPRKISTFQEGQRAAWEHFGYKVVETSSFSDLNDYKDVEYIWVDADYLKDNLECLESLIHQDTWTIFVPYSSEEILQQLPGLHSSSHVVLLQKPLIWHTFEARASSACDSHIQTLRTTNDVVKLPIPADPPAQIDSIIANKKFTILLVEDNRVNQMLGIKMLNLLGYTVLIASDGDEAISVILKHDATIDIILMDQSMPNKDGITATHEIRQLEADGKLLRKHIIIAVTAVVNSESRASFSRAGADDFLSKPLSLGTLEQTLAMFLRAE